MKFHKTYLFFLLFFFISCSNKIEYVHFDSTISTIKEKDNIDSIGLKNWYNSDILYDTIPGISLEKAFLELSLPKAQNIIVALIDTEVDLRHEKLKRKIWKNENEIPYNGIDDDKNGYIDDIHGWNFLGNSTGEDLVYANFESTRLIKKFDSIFSNKNINEIDNNKLDFFLEYSRAKKSYDKELNDSKYYIEEGKIIQETYQLAHKKLSPYFSNKDYDIEVLDNLGKKIPELEEFTSLISRSLEYNVSEKDIANDLKKYEDYINKYLNLEYNDRELLNDNPYNLDDKNYGNNRVIKESYILNHGTLMAGILTSEFDNQIKSNKIKIMPLSISPRGDEHDKDIALAIMYAVDNGARVINMSSGKEFSTQKEWVISALRYANEKDVLFITSAGNDNSNINFKSYSTYPNDDIYGEGEIINNFIMVGNSTPYIQSLREESSNYNKIHVDIFAPGTEIYTTSKNNSHEYITGTSASAAIVSKTAALIMSHYPNLKASKVKEILMESGVAYNVKVEIKKQDGTKKLIPFSELSKSGKVVNAYNALLLAEQVSKGKN